jgi:hypothetical protein
MTDANFVLDSCACCARQKRRCKLTQVTFPPVDSTVPPAWLPWNAEEWLIHRESWYKQVDECLNIRSYLRVFFKQEERLRTAQIEGHITGDSDGHRFDTTFSSFLSEDLANSWLRRVVQWGENLNRDLCSDSVPAPGCRGERWLLFRSSSLNVDEQSDGITCFLCKHCRGSLSQVTKGDPPKPQVRMPERARANGMWHGPDPVELQDLSYAECKVINLAKIYVSVKRIFLDRGSYAGTTKSEAPWYHQKNVVAYPQNADAALRAVGLSPEHLAKVLCNTWETIAKHCVLIPI